jgi:hypothetical protein
MQKQQFFNHCFQCTDIQEGDTIPVGGGTIGSTEVPWKVKADFEKFYQPFAETAERNAKQFTDTGWQNWFTTNLPNIDPTLATTLQTFTTAFEAKRKLQKSDEQQRKLLYDRANGKCLTLSQILSDNHARCIEIALLAQKFLSEKGVKSRLFSGEALFNYTSGEANTPAPHTFLIIEHQGQEYIFDPANPTVLQNGTVLFSLLKPCTTFASRTEDLKKDCFMIAAENVITKRASYYGVGDCGNVPETLIIHGSTSEGVKQRDTSWTLQV